jgi:hypothetical protein
MSIRNLFIFSFLLFACLTVSAQSPNKKLPIIKNGGYVIFEKNGHGLIASVENLGKLDYNEAIKACDSLQVGGFSDWRLPTREEFELIHPKLNLKKVGGGSIFQSSWYWTSTEVDKQNAWTHNLQTGLQASYFKDFKCFVKAVRSF